MSGNTASTNSFKATMQKLGKQMAKTQQTIASKIPKKHTFTYPSSNPEDKVFLCGSSFNDWQQQIPMVFDSKTKTFRVKVALKGPTEYKFIVNGEWVCDDAQPKTVNEGNENNVVVA